MGEDTSSFIDTFWEQLAIKSGGKSKRFFVTTEMVEIQ